MIGEIGAARTTINRYSEVPLGADAIQDPRCDLGVNF
jgi:hypothetical protein